MYWILCLWIERNRLDSNCIPQPQLLLLIVVQEISPPCLGACQTFSWHMLNRCRQPDCLSSNRLKVIVVHHMTMQLHVWGGIIMSKSRNSRRNVYFTFGSLQYSWLVHVSDGTCFTWASEQGYIHVHVNAGNFYSCFIYLCFIYFDLILSNSVFELHFKVHMYVAVPCTNWSLVLRVHCCIQNTVLLSFD